MKYMEDLPTVVWHDFNEDQKKFAKQILEHVHARQLSDMNNTTYVCMLCRSSAVRLIADRVKTARPGCREVSELFDSEAMTGRLMAICIDGSFSIPDADEAAVEMLNWLTDRCGLVGFLVAKHFMDDPRLEAIRDYGDLYEEPVFDRLLDLIYPEFTQEQAKSALLLLRIHWVEQMIAGLANELDPVL